MGGMWWKVPVIPPLQQAPEALDPGGVGLVADVLTDVVVDLLVVEAGHAVIARPPHLCKPCTRARRCLPRIPASYRDPCARLLSRLSGWSLGPSRRSPSSFRQDRARRPRGASPSTCFSCVRRYMSHRPQPGRQTVDRCPYHASRRRCARNQADRCVIPRSRWSFILDTSLRLVVIREHHGNR